uniref:Uncharacterized protein n=1 Tax=Leptobrachium leishanense TaxID=445787 RepID=A0A8C5QSY1_9ANUR
EKWPQQEILMCLHIDGAKGETSVNVTLNTNNGAITLLERNLTEESFFSCDPFQVLGSIADNEDVATVSVSITSLGKVENKVSKVLLKRKRSKILIQTDKAVYKPGQHVKFRVMSLYENLLPCLQPDPGKNRIGQWLNVSVDQGIAEFSLPLSEEPPLGEYAIKVKDTEHTFSVEEYGEGPCNPYSHLLSAQSQTQVSTTLEKVSFVDADNSYKAGIPYTVKVRHHFQQTIKVARKIKLYQWRHLAATSMKEESPSLTTSQHVKAKIELSPFYSKSSSFLKLHSLENVLPCEGQQDVRVDYILKDPSLNPKVSHLDLHYLVGYTEPQCAGVTFHDILRGWSNSFNSLFPHSVDSSPSLKVFVYVFLPRGEIVADLATFKVQKCFQNKVSVGFSRDEVLPGSDMSLQIQADPGSLCGLRVVDQSVTLMEPEKELTAEKVRYSLNKTVRSSDVWLDWLLTTRIYFLIGSKLRKHQISESIVKLDSVTSADSMDSSSENDTEDPQAVQEVERIRTYFPETWLWELKAVRDSGSVVLHKSAPDTITDWKAGALCMGPSGFGLSPPTSLRVFKPFFVDVTMPSSVVRGETFVMKASVFNYMKECIKVQTTMGSSKELMEEPCDDCLRSSCLCSDESKTFTWNLKAMKLGEKCNVSRLPLILQRSGGWDNPPPPLSVQRRTRSGAQLFYCSDQVIMYSESRPLGFIFAVGDLMGSAMQNPGRLLAMPYGCGEQNMGLFAPNIYVLQYLENTHQLNEEIQGKAKRFLESGYQRQLTYKRDDGSYRMFVCLYNASLSADSQVHWERPSAKPRAKQSSWYRAASAEVELTAYMLMTSLSGPEKDLGRASEMVNWLSRQQNPYGGFSSTTDTVVALQSLAKYAEATFSDARDVTVTVRSQTGVQEFHVDKTNRLLLQKASLPDIPGDYTLTASGSGCVYVQTVLRYNVPPPRSDAAFAVRVEVKPDQCPGESVKKLQLNIHTEYTGSRAQSNMAIVEVKLLSGFIPVKSSVRELEKNKVIQRSDISMDMVTLYLNELKHESVHLPFMVEQDIEVKNLKPATVKVYDYYETGEYGIGEYNSPCSSGKETINILQRTLFMPGVSNLSPPDLLELHLP